MVRVQDPFDKLLVRPFVKSKPRAGDPLDAGSRRRADRPNASHGSWRGVRGGLSNEYLAMVDVNGTTHNKPCHDHCLHSLDGPSADCRGLTQVPHISSANRPRPRGRLFGFAGAVISLGWDLQGKATRTPHQSKGSGGTV